MNGYGPSAQAACYKKAWIFAIKRGDHFTIQTEDDLDKIVNEDMIRHCKGLYGHIRIKTITESIYNGCKPLYAFFQELRNTELLADAPNRQLDHAIASYESAKANIIFFDQTGDKNKSKI